MAQTPKDALSAFQKLNDSVYISDPENYHGNGPLVLLSFWMNATPRPIARYVMEYRRLLPSARFVIVLAETNDFIFKSKDATQDTILLPAVDALRSFAGPDKPVFIHLFSNGGVFKVSNLLRLYKSKTGTALPISSMIFDSAPGVSTIKSGVRAISFQLPKFWIWRMLSKTALWLFLVFLEVCRKITRTPNAMDVASRRINDQSLYTPPTEGLTRCYIYSDSDQIIPSNHVEDHMKSSASCGVTVDSEKFEGADHVMAMMTDPIRYWSIVQRCLQLENTE
ncbi:hypothetical protein N7478_010429 [Penicillium angulare]|uniref:uncharacterized protein n=1 Tax=Penicillium angulare TaxID=116970 RepID=UPI00253F9949|nr:uncharacterized protein N7478_010429 [Penicillium angulare]KAJ5267621.1 hypothetical protein N7478_010429 [Penicillium angulare]